jgi:hypothetical protein
MRSPQSNRQFRRQRGIGRSISRHKWTRLKIAVAASKLEAESKYIEAGHLWGMLSHEERQKPLNQRQRRKARRAAAGMGDKRAFGKS